jgi:hypothetical protein
MTAFFNPANRLATLKSPARRLNFYGRFLDWVYFRSMTAADGDTARISPDDGE